MNLFGTIRAMPSKQRAAAKYLAGFFALMALLTFLSRAADSFTVPVVTTERIFSGTLEYKVTCEGSLYPVAQTPVFAPAGYRILALHVRQGGRVSAGDKLAELDTSQMQEQLDDARAELQRLRLTAAVNASEVFAETDESGIDDAIRALDRALEDLETTDKESLLRVESAEGSLFYAGRYLRELREMDDVSDIEIDAAREAVFRQQQALDEACLAREKSLETARRAVQDAELRLEQEKAVAEKNAERTAADKRRNSLEREAFNIDIGLAQQRVDKLESLMDTGGVITADIDGVVTKISGGAGSITTAESLFVVSDSSAGMVFRTNISEDESKHIRPGDIGSLVLTGEGRAVDAVVERIAEDGGSFTVEASLPEGNWEPGTGGKMTVTQKTASYPICVTNGAVRKDQTGGYFVLVARETKGVLGVQTVAERVNVGILDQSATRCAIEGLLGRDDLIIVGGSRPVSAGDRVRTE